MADFNVRSLGELKKLLHKHATKRKRNCRKVIKRCAQHMRKHVIAHTLPIAFRTLEHSLHVEISRGRIALVADAPHAAAVEVGSRPHWAPLKPLVEWVRLRGMQGATNEGRKKPRYTRGSTTKLHSERIHQELQNMAQANAMCGEKTGDGYVFQGISNGVGDVASIARAIQLAIAKNGTKPQWYMRSALPEVQEFFDREFRIAMADVSSGGAAQAAE